MCEVKVHIPINSLPTEVSPQYPLNSQFTACHIQYHPPFNTIITISTTAFHIQCHVTYVIYYFLSLNSIRYTPSDISSNQLLSNFV